MRVRRFISMGVIRCERPLPFDGKTLEYANALKDGAEFPPIKLQYVGDGKWNVKDGRHRYLAHKLAGKSEIYAKFYKEEEREEIYNGGI